MDFQSQRKIAESAEPEASVFPSGENVTQPTTPECPFSFDFTVPDAKSQMIIEPSSDPATRFLSLAENAAQPIAFESPVSCVFEKEAIASVPEDIRSDTIRRISEW